MKRILAFVLTLVVALSILPVSADAGTWKRRAVDWHLANASNIGSDADTMWTILHSALGSGATFDTTAEISLAGVSLPPFDRATTDKDSVIVGWLEIRMDSSTFVLHGVDSIGYAIDSYFGPARQVSNDLKIDPVMTEIYNGSGMYTTATAQLNPKPTASGQPIWLPIVIASTAVINSETSNPRVAGGLNAVPAIRVRISPRGAVAGGTMLSARAYFHYYTDN